MLHSYKKGGKEMKKILGAFIIFLACALFYYTYDSFNYIHYSNILNLENALSNEKHCYNLVIENQEKAEDLVKAVTAYSDDHNIQFIIKKLMPTEDGTYLYHYYVQTVDDRWIYKSIHMTSGKKISLTSSTNKQYLSSDSNDKNAAGTFSSYNNKHFSQENEVIQIMNVSNLNAADEPIITFYLDSEESAKDIKNFLSNYYTNDFQFQAAGGYGGSEESIQSTYRSGEILFVIICSIMITIFLIICLITKDKKEILIMRLHGRKTLSIAIKLYLRFLAVLYLLFTISTFLLLMFFTDVFDPYFSDLINESFSYMLYGMILVPIVLLASAIYIKTTTHVLELKNNQSYSLMNYANIGLKIIISIVVLSPFITTFNRLIPNLQKYQYLKTNESYLRSFYTFSYFNGSSEELQKIYDQTIYFDMSDYAYMNDYTAYSLTGLSLYDYQGIEESLPLLYVNKTYLIENNYQFYDEDHNKIDLSKFKEKTYLIPLGKSAIYRPDDGTAVYVESTGVHKNLHADQPLYQVKQPILVYYPKYTGMNIYPNNVLFSNKSRSEIEALVSSITNKSFLVHQMDANISRELINCEDTILSCASITIIFILLYGLFIIQFCYLYMDNYKKEIAIGYLNGKSKIERYGSIWLINFIIYVIVILASLLLNHYPISICIEFSLLFFILDTINILFFIHKTEKHEMVPALRGGI